MNIKHIQVTRPEIQKTLFNKITGRNGKTYLYNGNSVFVEDGEGMGGRDISFKMTNKTEEIYKGPWNTNANELLEQTGIDLTKMHYSFGLVFKNRQEALAFEKGEDVEPFISDKNWTIGEFDGGEKRMRELLDERFYVDGYQVVMVNSNGGVSIMTYKFEEVL
jgi:predicted RNase H-like nuclease (RuvC/YqgF family)